MCWEKIIGNKFIYSHMIFQKWEQSKDISNERNKTDNLALDGPPLNKILYDILKEGEKWSNREDLRYKKEWWVNVF